MLKKCLALMVICWMLPLPVRAQELSEEVYRSQLAYRRDRLMLVTKKRLIDEKRSSSYTDIDTISYSWEAYTYSDTDISTQSLARAEVKEVTDWYIYKGGLRELSDIEFLELVGDRTGLERVLAIDGHRSRLQTVGNVSIGLGFLTMVGAAAFSGGQTMVTGGAVLMAAGFFMSALNSPPAHYIEPDYAQERIDEYNITLKKRLNLPLSFE